MWYYIKLKRFYRTKEMINKMKNTIENGENICKPYIWLGVNIQIYKELYLGIIKEQVALVCCSPWGHKESDVT